MSYLASGGRWSPILERKPEVLPECEKLPKLMIFLMPLYFWSTVTGLIGVIRPVRPVYSV